MTSKELPSAEMSSAKTFHFADIVVDQSSNPNPDRVFSDHMFEVEWTSETGWGTPRICLFHPLSLHPAAQVMQYAIELFEDMKAYKGQDGHIRLFRPDRHIYQMLRSVRRAALPEFDAVELQKCLLRLIDIDRDWVPCASIGALLVRAVIISTDANLQVTVPKKALLYVITCPTEADDTSLSLLAETSYIRVKDDVWGCTKMGSHYVGAMTLQQEAAVKHGCHEVLWLLAPQRHLTQAGDMNVFVLWINAEDVRELVTPSAASRVILPGVVRNSLLHIAQDWDDFEVTERMFSIDEVILAVKQGRVQEMFGCCTESGVRPITEIVYEGDRYTIPSVTTEQSVTAKFHRHLLAIQTGGVPSDWVVNVK